MWFPLTRERPSREVQSVGEELSQGQGCRRLTSGGTLECSRRPSVLTRARIKRFTNERCPASLIAKQIGCEAKCTFVRASTSAAVVF